MKKFKAVWELMRLEHGLMIFLGILIGSVIALEGNAIPTWNKIILTFFTALFLESSTFALNDYLDFEIDKKNKRLDRPLVRGDVNPKTAIYIFYIFFPMGILCSYFVNIYCFIIAAVTGILSIFYDYHMKKIKLIGNFYIAYVMAIPFFFGGAAAIERNIIFLNINPAIYIVGIIAFLTGFGREIMKDVQDFEGDIEKGVKSFPKYIGKRKSVLIAAFFYIFAVVLSFIPFFTKIFNIYYFNFAYLLLVIVTDITLIISSIHLIKDKEPNLKKCRRLTLIALFFGLVAFLIGALINL
jgi:geranylgeranylglycerol-phosphate geranylgeranyltransferase